MSESIQRVSWDAFLADHFRWAQGEHITMIGPTGSGKTTLALELLPMRQYVIAYGTKPRDKTMEKVLRSKAWRRIKKQEKMPRVIQPGRGRFVFWPEYRTPDDLPLQGHEIGKSLAEAFTTGGWCLFIDETWWFTHQLGLKKWLEALWSQGRSIGISVVAGTQRPVHIPLLAYDQATHVFFWRDNDETNLKRISGMNGLKAQLIRSTVASLAPHEVLYVNTRTAAMTVTKPPK